MTTISQLISNMESKMLTVQKANQSALEHGTEIHQALELAISDYFSATRFPKTDPERQVAQTAINRIDNEREARHWTPLRGLCRVCGKPLNKHLPSQHTCNPCDELIPFEVPPAI